MKKFITPFALLLVFTLFVSCNDANKQEEKETTITEKDIAVLEDSVLSKEDQNALTPNMVIQDFKDGNARFMNNDLTERNHSEQVRNSTKGQAPKAIVLSCVDSRVPAEYVFDQGIGDVFVARVAGNFVNEDILGSMEFACKVSGSKLIMVMGHEHCGAVKAAIGDVKLGNITSMLSKIRPVLETISYDGERTAENPEFVHMVCESNVKNTIEEIRKQSPILKEMEDNGEIKIVGGIYDLDNGKVQFLN